MRHALDRVRAGEDDPPCRQCGGILKSATISFGQALVPEVIERADAVPLEADLLLAIGTSLQVYPVAGLVPIADASGARVVIINARADAPGRCRRCRHSGAIGEVLPRICAGRTHGVAERR